MRKEVVLKRNGRIIGHHIINKVMGGKKKLSNILRFDEGREKIWHYLFNNLSFDEVARQLNHNLIVISDEKKPAWNFLFGDKSFEKVAELLIRTQVMKRKQGMKMNTVKKKGRKRKKRKRR